MGPCPCSRDEDEDEEEGEERKRKERKKDLAKRNACRQKDSSVPRGEDMRGECGGETRY